MLLNEVYAIADAIAPKSLSDEMCAKFGFYDNSGVLVDTGEPIDGILFSLDFSDAAVERAVDIGANLIVTHHPAIYGKISDIRLDDQLGNKLVRCLKNGISVLSMHLNLDSAQGGLDESLRDGILNACSKTTGAGMQVNENFADTEREMYVLTKGAYGRVYDVPQTTLGNLCVKLKGEFDSEKIFFYDRSDTEIKRVASFCGAGADEESVRFAKEEGADAIVSADFKHHVLTMAQEAGLSVIVMTHYASENYGFKKFYEKICRQVGVPCTYHTDEHLL